MQNIFVLFPFILVALIVFIFITLMLKSKKLDPVEIGKVLVAEKNCSGIIGGIRLQGPFIQIRFYEDFLVVSYYKKIILHYVEITPGNEKILLNRGLVLHHNNGNYPNRILLYVNNIQEIIDYIEGRKKLLMNSANTI